MEAKNKNCPYCDKNASKANSLCDTHTKMARDFFEQNENKDIEPAKRDWAIGDIVEVTSNCHEFAKGTNIELIYYHHNYEAWKAIDKEGYEWFISTEEAELI